MRALILTLALAACAPLVGPAPGGAEGPEVRREGGAIETLAPAGAIAVHEGMAPPGADPSVCWGRDVRPARVVTESVQVVTPEGALITRTRQRIDEDRREVWFRAPCPPAMTEEFVASLQRALLARGLYAGPVDGRMSRETRRGIRTFQEPRGLPAGTLSLDAARALGLVPVADPG